MVPRCRTGQAQPGRSDIAAPFGHIASSGARRICAGSCEPMPAITITLERIGRWTKMRRPFAPFSGSGTSCHKRSSVGFIIATFGFRFSVHTAVVPKIRSGGARGAASSGGPWGHPRLHRQQTLALHLFAGELAGAADGFRFLPGSLLGGFFVTAAELHLAEDALALHLFLQHPIVWPLHPTPIPRNEAAEGCSKGNRAALSFCSKPANQ